MKIHTTPLIEPDRVVIFKDTVQVIDGPLSALICEDDGEDDSCIDVFLNPASVETFKAKLPHTKWRTIQ